MGYSDIKELLRDAKNIATGANDIQLKGLLLDIQDMVYELQEENRELREENHELKNKKIIEDELFQSKSFWKRPGKEYIYCPRCWGKDSKLIVCNLSVSMGSDNKIYKYGRCPVCDYQALK